MKRDLELIWSQSKEAFPNAERVDVASELEPYASQCALDCEELLSHWLVLLNETNGFLISMLRIAEEAQKGVTGSQKTSPFMMLVARAISLVRGITVLITHGQEQPAWIVARSLIETLEFGCRGSR